MFVCNSLQVFTRALHVKQFGGSTVQRWGATLRQTSAASGNSVRLSSSSNPPAATAASALKTIHTASPAKKTDKVEVLKVYPESLLPSQCKGWTGKAYDLKNLIQYEDDHIIVIFKPAGVMSQPHSEESLVQNAEQEFITVKNNRYNFPARDILTLAQEYVNKTNPAGSNTNVTTVGLVHRLDRSASGLMVLSKSAEALRNLNQQFRDRVVIKRYLCMVNGQITEPASCVDYFLKGNDEISKIVRNPFKNVGAKQKLREDVVQANLDYKPVHVNEHISKKKLANTEATKAAKVGGKVTAEVTKLMGDGFSEIKRFQSLIDITLHTGRKHQIRAQMASRGMPVVGDLKYQAPQSFGEHDIALHAYYLCFYYPAKNTPHGSKKMAFRVDCPRIWEKRFGPEVAAKVKLLAARPTSKEEVNE